MGYIHCCSGLRESKNYAIKPEENYLFAQLDYLEECPVCGHCVAQLTRIDANNKVTFFRKTNDKARKLFNKLKALILFEKKIKSTNLNYSSKFYLYYNEYGVKKKCYGACMRLKGNTQYNKFSYWYGMYKDSLSSMRAKVGMNALETPQINLFRR